jgi:hypothetical protein
MKKRVLLVAASVVLAGGVVALWFGVLREKPKPMTEEEKVAKLLVGSWKMTKCYYPHLAPDVEFLAIFYEGGRFDVQSSHPFDGVESRTGTYRVEGTTIHFHAVATKQHEETSWDKGIERITETELTLVGPEEPGGKRHRADFQRSELRSLPVPPRPPSAGPIY